MERKLTFRLADLSDAELLGRLNFLLIRGEGHRNPMSESGLAARMEEWLRSNYKAALFYSGVDLVGYALWRGEGADSVYPRQFFAARGWRSRGIGKVAFSSVRKGALTDRHQNQGRRSLQKSGRTRLLDVTRFPGLRAFAGTGVKRCGASHSVFRIPYSVFHVPYSLFTLSSRVDGILG